MAVATHGKTKGKAKADILPILDDPTGTGINLHHLARADSRITEGTGIRVKKKARSRANSDDEVCSISFYYFFCFVMLLHN